MKRDVLTDSACADTWTWSPAQKKAEKKRPCTLPFVYLLIILNILNTGCLPHVIHVSNGIVLWG